MAVELNATHLANAAATPPVKNAVQETGARVRLKADIHSSSRPMRTGPSIASSG